MVLTRSERNRLVSAGMNPDLVEMNVQNVPQTTTEAGMSTVPSMVMSTMVPTMTTNSAAITPAVQPGHNSVASNPQASSTSIASPEYSSITARNDGQGVRTLEEPMQRYPSSNTHHQAGDNMWRDEVTRQMQQFQLSLQEIARAIGQQGNQATATNNQPIPAPLFTPPAAEQNYGNVGSVQANYNGEYTQHFRPVRAPQHAQGFRHVSSPVDNIPAYEQRAGKVDLSKWGVKFDGSARSMSAEDFIFRLNSLRQDYGCTFTEVLRGFHQLLEGQALDWYWNVRKLTPLHTWQDLETAFLNQYRRYESEFQIQRKIMDRRQLPQESFEDFFNAVIKLRNQQRSPYTERDLMEIMRGNLKPALSHLTFSMQFNCLNDFCREVKRAENLLAGQRHPQPRPFPLQRVNEVAYEVADPCPEDPEVDALTGISRYTCWNCRQVGHGFMECPSTTRRLFCFKCGRDGVVTPKCPNCQGNLRKNQSYPGQTRSTQT